MTEAAASKVGRRQVTSRGFSHRCPNCGRHTLFEPLPKWFAVKQECSSCGLVFERSEGFFLGAMVISYTFAGAALIPILVLVVAEKLDVVTAMLILIAWCIVFPLVFYRTSKSLWLMAYYFAVPGDLPANGGKYRKSFRAAGAQP